MSDLVKKAAIILGRRGGLKRVPKGFSMKTPEQCKAAGEKASLKRWGKIIRFEDLTLACLPRDVENIMKAATHQGPDGNRQRPHDLSAAVLSLILDALKPYKIGLVVADGMEVSDSQISKHTRMFFRDDSDNERGNQQR